jgi:hypothetical protein
LYGRIVIFSQSGTSPLLVLADLAPLEGHNLDEFGGIGHKG